MAKSNSKKTGKKPSSTTKAANTTKNRSHARKARKAPEKLSAMNLVLFDFEDYKRYGDCDDRSAIPAVVEAWLDGVWEVGWRRRVGSCRCVVGVKRRDVVFGSPGGSME